MSAEPNDINQSVVSDNTTLIEATDSSSSPDFGAAAKTLANGLCGLAPAPLNVLGAALVSAFWPSGGDAKTDWSKVYDSLQTIVQNGLAKSEMEGAKTKLDGVVNYLASEYSSLKSSGASKSTLESALEPYDVAFFLDIVDVFQHASSKNDDLAAAALANFMTGASLHLALLQERALVDPNATTPSASAYAKTLEKLAKKYGEYATQTAPKILAIRLNQITEVVETTHNYPSINTLEFKYSFTDNHTGQTWSWAYNEYIPPWPPGGGLESDDKPPLDDASTSEPSKSAANNAATQARNNLISSVTNNLNALLSKEVTAVVTKWKTLETNPIPTIST